MVFEANIRASALCHYSDAIYTYSMYSSVDFLQFQSFHLSTGSEGSKEDVSTVRNSE